MTDQRYISPHILQKEQPLNFFSPGFQKNKINTFNSKKFELEQANMGKLIDALEKEKELFSELNKDTLLVRGANLIESNITTKSYSKSNLLERFVSDYSFCLPFLGLGFIGFNNPLFKPVTIGSFALFFFTQRYSIANMNANSNDREKNLLHTYSLIDSIQQYSHNSRVSPSNTTYDL